MHIRPTNIAKTVVLQQGRGQAASVRPLRGWWLSPVIWGGESNSDLRIYHLAVQQPFTISSLPVLQEHSTAACARPIHGFPDQEATITGWVVKGSTRCSFNSLTDRNTVVHIDSRTPRSSLYRCLDIDISLPSCMIRDTCDAQGSTSYCYFRQ